MGADENRVTTQVSVTIAGHVYRMACAEGEEARLQGLARLIDERIETLKRNFGEIGDQRLVIMAAITVADDLTEARSRIGVLEAELADLHSDSQGATSARDEWTDRMSQMLDETATRIERLAQNLNNLGR